MLDYKKKNIDINDYLWLSKKTISNNLLNLEEKKRKFKKLNFTL